MAAPSVYTVVREILTTDREMTADAVISRARAKGVTTPAPAIRRVIYNTRSELRKRAKAAPAAARQTAQPKPSPAPEAAPAAPVAPSPVPVAAAAPAPSDLSTVFANVTLVNQVLGRCGGVDNVRQVAEAVRACGGVDAFLQHIDLVAGLRGGAV